MKPILVTSYVNPDLDGLASAVAYAEYLNKTGKNAVVAILGEPHDEAKYLLYNYDLPDLQKIQNTNDFDEVILVDASDLNVFEGKISPEKIIEVIDHRKINEAHKFPNAKIQIELVCAAATLIAEKFYQNKIDISKQSAILLFGAIISNTLNFKGTVTTDRDREASEWLNKVAQLPENFWKNLFLAKSELSGNKLQDRVEHDFAWFEMANKKVGIAQIEMIGAKKLIGQRCREIIELLNKMKVEMNLNYIFLTICELEDLKNFFVTEDLSSQKLLEKVFGVKFSNNVAERPNLIMRKQIVPLLKEELEK